MHNPVFFKPNNALPLFTTKCNTSWFSNKLNVVLEDGRSVSAVFQKWLIDSWSFEGGLRYGEMGFVSNDGVRLDNVVEYCFLIDLFSLNAERDGE